MRQHPDQFHDEDLDRYDEAEQDPEELGTPVYQGSSLSVRALTAEELQRFLDAHADQPAELLGSGWAALDPPGHPLWESPDPAGPDAAGGAGPGCPGSSADVGSGTGSYVGSRASKITPGHHLHPRA
jgi:hypothetical protein